MILPYLTYGIETWYAAPNVLTSRISILQKKSIRAIHNLAYNSHTNDYFKQDNILKLQDLYKTQICTKLFSYSLAPNNEFHHRLNSHTNVHNHYTRNRHNLILPNYTKTSSQNSFLYQSIKEWCNIPSTLKHPVSISTFKHKLKSHYCSLY